MQPFLQAVKCGKTLVQVLKMLPFLAVFLCPCLQSSDIAQQLESTQDSLDVASAELHALQQQLQDERQAHQQSLAIATAEAASAQQQLQDEHDAKLAALHEQQQKELCELQLAGQQLDGQLVSAKEQLTAALQELDSERSSSGRLHQEVTKLHHEFEDACEYFELHGRHAFTRHWWFEQSVGAAHVELPTSGRRL